MDESAPQLNPSEGVVLAPCRSICAHRRASTCRDPAGRAPIFAEASLTCRGPANAVQTQRPASPPVICPMAALYPPREMVRTAAGNLPCPYSFPVTMIGIGVPFRLRTPPKFSKAFSVPTSGRNNLHSTRSNQPASTITFNGRMVN